MAGGEPFAARLACLPDEFGHEPQPSEDEGVHDPVLAGGGTVVLLVIGEHHVDDRARHEDEQAG